MTSANDHCALGELWNRQALNSSTKTAAAQVSDYGSASGRRNNPFWQNEPILRTAARRALYTPYFDGVVFQFLIGGGHGLHLGGHRRFVNGIGGGARRGPQISKRFHPGILVGLFCRRQFLKRLSVRLLNVPRVHPRPATCSLGACTPLLASASTNSRHSWRRV